MRTILHSDCNNFYASVECAFDPHLRGKPLVVCGDPKARHGIVLAKSDLAKKCGIRTGEALWVAKQKCPDLVVLPPCGEKYLRFSKIMREIYSEYSNQVEAFGLDESWLDVSGSMQDGIQVASLLRSRAREELGITLSIGVSFNKVFAKLGSDMHKPDATTVISEKNYREKIWPLQADNLLFIGKQTMQKLHDHGLHTIGDVANAVPSSLRALFGVNGDILHAYACGQDESPVLPLLEEDTVKSIGNSTTPPFDITDSLDAQRILYLLSDSVAERMRRQAFLCRSVTLWTRDTALHSNTHQMLLREPTDLSLLIVHTALTLLSECWDKHFPLRSLGVQCGELVSAYDQLQLSLLKSHSAERQLKLENTVDRLRTRFGHTVLCRGAVLRKCGDLQADLSAGGLSAANMAALHRREV